MIQQLYLDCLNLFVQNARPVIQERGVFIHVDIPFMDQIVTRNAIVPKNNVILCMDANFQATQVGRYCVIMAFKCLYCYW